MRNTLLISCALILLSSCAQTEKAPSPQVESSRRMPEAVANPPPASVEGTLLKSYQDLYDGMLNDLQKLQSDSEERLNQLLARLRGSPLPTAPVEGMR